MLISLQVFAQHYFSNGVKISAALRSKMEQVARGEPIYSWLF
jgi:hypothetical protein